MDPYEQVPERGQVPAGGPVPDRAFWEPKSRSPWRVVGIVAAVLFVVLGMAVVALLVLATTSASFFGSNK